MTLQIAEPQTKRWTREEHYGLAEQGWFTSMRVQLIDGEIIQMPPQGHEHAISIMRTTRWLHNVCGSGHLVRVQMPLDALQSSDPEPDLAVVPGPIEAYTGHPRTALLVIDVNDSSLHLDRRKASLYAAAGVQDYWIVDLNSRCIEVYRHPAADSSAEFGSSYASATIVEEAGMIAPLTLPQASVKVRDLLP